MKPADDPTPMKSLRRPLTPARAAQQPSTLALVKQCVYNHSLGALVGLGEWLLHREAPAGGAAGKPARSDLRRTSSRTQLARV